MNVTTAFSSDLLTNKSEMKFSEELNIMIGMANVSFTENQSQLTGPNASEAASGSISSINTLLHYRFKNDSQRSWFVQANVPLASGATGSYLSSGGGLEFIWGKAASRTILKDSTTSLTISPTLRYFAAIEANIAYIAYLTETAKRSDTLLELGGYGGISYKVSNYHLRVQAGIDRGIGVNTTTLGMKAMLGGTIFLD